jgi:hypothetical protein
MERPAPSVLFRITALCCLCTQDVKSWARVACVILIVSCERVLKDGLFAIDGNSLEIWRISSGQILVFELGGAIRRYPL